MITLRSCDGISNSAMTTHINWNGATVNFTQREVLGLSNPFILEGLDVSWMVFKIDKTFSCFHN